MFLSKCPQCVALAASLGGVCIRRWGALPAVTERGRLCVHALILQECRWATRAAGVRDAWRPSVQVGHSSSAMAGMHALDHMHTGNLNPMILYVRLSLDLSWQARRLYRPCAPANARGSAHPRPPLCFPSLRHRTPCSPAAECPSRLALGPPCMALQVSCGAVAPPVLACCALPCHWDARTLAAFNVGPEKLKPTAPL